MNRTTLVFAAAALLASASALAQQKTVFRCNSDGKTTYSDSPCKGAALVAADDARSDTERKAAVEVAQREEKLAQRLTNERRAAEKAAGSPVAAHIPYSAAEKAAADRPSSKKLTKKKVRVRVATQP